MTSNSRVHFLIGPILLAAAIALLPSDVLMLQARAAIGTVLWMGWWWVAMPVAPGVTGLLPLAVNAFIPMVPMAQLTPSYFCDIVVLLLGSNIISIIWELTGFDKRLAMKSLCLLGGSLPRHILVWTLSAVLLSAVLPNAVVCSMLVPIAFSMFDFLAEDGKHSPDSVRNIILACIVWGCGLGGMATPLGGAMNLVAIAYVEQLTGTEFLYLDWIINLMPYFLCLVAAVLTYALLARPRDVRIRNNRLHFIERYSALPAFSRDECLGLILFAVPLLLSFMRGLYAAWLPALKPAYLFLVCGLFPFVLRRTDGTPLATWREVEPKIEWGLLFLFGGGLAMGTLLTGSGAVAGISNVVKSLHMDAGILLLAMIIAVTMLFVEIATNTAAAAIVVPLVVSICIEMDLDPIPYVFATAAAFNAGFMLPTSIRAIGVAYGLDPGYLFRNGLVLTSLSIAIITIISLPMLG